MAVARTSILSDSGGEYESLASSPFTTLLTSGAVPQIRSAHYADYGFIDILGLAQRLGVYFLPIAWESPLRPLGRGGQADISQTLFNLQASFAFKSFRPGVGANDANMQELINEMVILSLPLFRKHPYIVGLEGLCFDVSGDGQVSSVLVFEKAQFGDLDHFISTTNGDSISLEDRLNICVDIGIAIKDMHSNGILHGDISPKNVLVFPGRNKNWVAKVTDFGYSTRFCGGQDFVRVPKSVPWNAPEHHNREFLASKAQKMDVYSFGALCLWILFEGKPIKPMHAQGIGSVGVSHFKDILISRTNEKGFLELALEVLEEDNRFGDNLKGRLSSFFASTLVSDPDKRDGNFNKLLCLLVPNRELPESPRPIDVETIPDCELFELANSFHEFYLLDFRVRQLIAEELQTQISSQTSKPSQQALLRHAALQVALCYQLGFGVPKDADRAKDYLENFDIPRAELEHRIASIKDGTNIRVQDGLAKDLETQGFLTQACLSQYYRERGQLQTCIDASWKDIDALEGALEQEHPLILILKCRLARILRDVGRMEEAEALDTQVVLIAEQCGELGLMCDSMSNLASTFQELGRLQEAGALRAQILSHLSSRDGPHHPGVLTALANLSSTYRSQGLWKQAEEIEVEILDQRRRTLGLEHIDTMSSQANLACTLWKQGKWEEAEKLEEEVVAASMKSLGTDHPLTLQYTWNLSSTYRSRGRLVDAIPLAVRVMNGLRKIYGNNHPRYLTAVSEIASMLTAIGLLQEAEALLRLVVNGKQSALGREHPSTLTSLSNLATSLQKQGKLEEAAEIELEVINLSSVVLGSDHQDTLTSEGNLASIYRKMERWEEAKDLEKRVLQASEEKLGADHPDTLTSMANLGAIFYCQSLYADAEKLLSRVVEKREELIGQDHTSTLTSMGNLALVYRGQKRWSEAEALERKVYETRTRLLGEAHPDTMTAVNNLATNLKTQGRSDEARELVESSSGKSLKRSEDNP